MTVQTKLKALGLELPAPPAPVGAYVPAVRTGKLIFTAGQLPTRDGKLTATGHVPSEVPLAEAREAALQACLNALSVLSSQPGGLDAVARIVRVNVFVNSSPGFTDQAQVANGASELLAALFGDAGRHTRCAVGVAALPLNAPVELDLVVEVA